MADWDDEGNDVDEVKPPGPRTDAWDGEDEDDDIKDAWDAESEEDSENKEEKSKESADVGKVVQKKKKKKLHEIIAEKEAARLQELEEKRLAQEEAESLITPEAKLAEKLRLQKMLEDQDFELAKDLYGVSAVAESSGINFNPSSQEDFDELRNNLLEKFKNIENNDLYQDFASSLINQMCVDLTVPSLKKVKGDSEGFISAKLKEERAQKAKKGKSAPKATIKMETDRSMFARGGDDFADMDDFM
jgi:translation initiation factor 3 subunit J